MIYNIPIESLEERYSKQWNEWFPGEFNRLNIQFANVYPQKRLSQIIREGSFLDVLDTNYFKANQLALICRLFDENHVMPGDIFFFHDLWFPGIEMLAYIRDSLKIDFKICGILHAGSYDHHDFLYRQGMDYWAQWIEQGWFRIFDAIFVATQFHKDLILERRGKHRENKIHVTGLPIYPEFVNTFYPKENIVVFPHRLDPEKNPDIWSTLITKIDNIEWDFISTKEICSSKKEYYNLLNQSKISVSFADQETWGIAMIESVLCGCIPLVPNRLSYEELYPAHFRFTTPKHCEGMIVKLITDPQYFEYMWLLADDLKQTFIRKGSEAIPNMVKIMETL